MALVSDGAATRLRGALPVGSRIQPCQPDATIIDSTTEGPWLGSQPDRPVLQFFVTAHPGLDGHRMNGDALPRQKLDSVLDVICKEHSVSLGRKNRLRQSQDPKVIGYHENRVLCTGHGLSLHKQNLLLNVRDSFAVSILAYFILYSASDRCFWSKLLIFQDIFQVKRARCTDNY
jgi:hypothetical protein